MSGSLVSTSLATKMASLPLRATSIEVIQASNDGSAMLWCEEEIKPSSAPAGGTIREGEAQMVATDADPFLANMPRNLTIQDLIVDRTKHSSIEEQREAFRTRMLDLATEGRDEEDGWKFYAETDARNVERQLDIYARKVAWSSVPTLRTIIETTESPRSIFECLRGRWMLCLIRLSLRVFVSFSFRFFLSSFLSPSLCFPLLLSLSLPLPLSLPLSLPFSHLCPYPPRHLSPWQTTLVLVESAFRTISAFRSYRRRQAITNFMFSKRLLPTGLHASSTGVSPCRGELEGDDTDCNVLLYLQVSDFTFPRTCSGR